MSDAIKAALSTLMAGQPCDPSVVRSVMDDIMTGALEPVQVAGFLIAMKIKGETPAELAAMAAAMQDKAERILAPENAIDTCGTGGDGSDTFNISTAAALLAASAGIPVAKHGNRAVTSKTGSADVLEALGYPIDAPVASVQRSLDETGFCYMHAPLMHPSMKHVMPVRRALGVPTTFNILGPLTNPARVRRQLLGVGSKANQRHMAQTLASLGHTLVWVVHSRDGLDELSLSAPTDVIEVRDGRLSAEFVIDPHTLGLPSAGQPVPTVRNAAESAEIIRAALTGRDIGAARDAVVLNAAAGAVVSGRVSDIKSGIALMLDAISGETASGLLAKIAR